MKFTGYHCCLLNGMAMFVNSVTAQSTICAEGYIMDDLCVQRGTLLDPEGTPTFANPTVHTVHCLIDVDACRESGFHVLQDPTTDGGEYSIAYTFTENSNAVLIDLMKAEGSCSNGCVGNAVDNFRIGVKGTTQEVDGTMQFEIIESAYISPGAVNSYCENITDDAGTPGDAPATAPAIAPFPVEFPVELDPHVSPEESPAEPAPAESPVTSKSVTHESIFSALAALVAILA